MALKHNSFSELKEKLADSLKVLRDGRGAKQRLKQTKNKAEKKESGKTKREVNQFRKSNGIAIFGGAASVKRRQNLDQSTGHKVKADDKEGLKGGSLPDSTTTNIEDEGNLKSLLNQ